MPTLSSPALEAHYLNGSGTPQLVTINSTTRLVHSSSPPPLSDRPDLLNVVCSVLARLGGTLTDIKIIGTHNEEIAYTDVDAYQPTNDDGDEHPTPNIPGKGLAAGDLHQPQRHITRNIVPAATTGHIWHHPVAQVPR